MKAWSYSGLSKFETCPRQFYYTKVSKTVVEPDTVYTVWGKEVHSAMEFRVKDGTPLPENMAKWEPIAAKFANAPGEVFTERQYAITRDMKQTEWDAADCWYRGIIDVGVDTGKVSVLGDYKGLALDCKLPTPEGWTTMGEVKIGARLFDSRGTPCMVVGKSGVKKLPCYQISFDDKSSVVCDEEHLWVTTKGVFSTTQLRDTIHKNSQAHHAIVVAEPIATEGVLLPVEPYVLGLWLGDGKHSSGEMCKPDPLVWAEVTKCGYSVGGDISGKNNERARSSTIYGLRRHLAAAGVLGNKHIPAVYLRASIAQRTSLVQGLMDSDGSVNTRRKQAIFSTTSKALSDGMMELLLSLGQRPSQAITTQHGFGKTVTAYPVSFKPIKNLVPFRAATKRDRLGNWGEARSWRRVITSVTRVATVETQCIKVDSPDRTFLCTDKFIPTHNTGKVKDDFDQMSLFAATHMTLKPEIEVSRAMYIWLAHNKVTRKDVKRELVPVIWADFMIRSRRLEKAYEQDKWLPSPSGLCNGWCPVGRANCEFWHPKKNK